VLINGIPIRLLSKFGSCSVLVTDAADVVVVAVVGGGGVLVGCNVGGGDK